MVLSCKTIAFTLQNVIFCMSKPMLLQPKKRTFRAFQKSEREVKVNNTWVSY